LYTKKFLVNSFSEHSHTFFAKNLFIALDLASIEKSLFPMYILLLWNLLKKIAG